jgi:hypothetical protein
MSDFGHLQACMLGPSVPQNDPGCLDAILDGDTDVDANDMTLLMNCLTGADIIADPACGI